MAAYTQLTKKDANALAADYGLPKVLSARAVREGSVNTHYLLETVRGKFIVKIDEVKSEIEVKRELDLLLFLRKHGFPCPVPLADRRGRHCRDWAGKQLSVYRIHRRPQCGTRRPHRRPSWRMWAGCWPTSISSPRRTRRASTAASASIASPRSTPACAAGCRTTSRRSFAPSTKSSSICRTTSKTKLPKGIIHGDLFSDNVMLQGREGGRGARLRGGRAGQVHLRPGDRGQLPLLRKRSLRAQEVRVADRRLRERCAPCPWPSGTRFPTSCASPPSALPSPGCAISSSTRSTSASASTRTFRISTSGCSSSAARGKAAWRRC